MNGHAPMTSEDFTAALQRAERLWPDPFDAPEVPDRELLREWLANPKAVEQAWPGLGAQIREEVNCQRALEILRAESYPDHLLHDFHASDEAGVADKRYRNALQTAPAAPVPSESKPQPLRQIHDGPEIGQLWSTGHRVEVLDENSRLEYRYLWQPMRVLLTDGPFTARGETIWRAVPCTPLPEWECGVGDCIVCPEGGLEYAAHLDLEFPVHIRQLRLGKYIGAVSEESLAAAEMDAPAKRPRVRIDNERLLAAASWLAVTADARRLWHEARAEKVAELSKLEHRMPDAIDWTQQHFPVLAAAAAGENPPIRCLAWPGNISALVAAVIDNKHIEDSVEFRAELRGEPQLDAATGLPDVRWRLRDAPEGLREGDTFEVLALNNLHRPIGAGVVRRAGNDWVAILETGDVQRCAASGDIVLVFPDLGTH